MHWAAFEGHAAVLEALLSDPEGRGRRSVDSMDANGWTALVCGHVLVLTG